MKLIYIYLIFLAIISCKKKEIVNKCNCETITTNTQNKATSNNSLQGKWKLEYFIIANGHKEKLPDNLNDISIKFEQDGTISFSAPINNGGAQYLYFNNSIKIYSILSTLKGGEEYEMNWEEKFVFALGNTCCFENKEKYLLFYFKEEENCKGMYFSKID